MSERGKKELLVDMWENPVDAAGCDEEVLNADPGGGNEEVEGKELENGFSVIVARRGESRSSHSWPLTCSTDFGWRGIGICFGGVCVFWLG